jgi:DNA-binding beta-propeller fold protein YncE
MLAGFAGEARGQKRVFARVEPQSLSFDVNINGSDNIAPNIIFSADGKRGFVAYTGSGVILMFSSQDGEILNRIQTGGKPYYITPLADQRSLAAVSVQDNRVFVIDPDSSNVAAFSFTDAQFGFGSILSLSPDGTVGYISSTGTGELIKFAMSDGHELGRLKGLQAPAQITVSKDGGLLLVVDTLKEELIFVDSSSLTQRNSLKGTPFITNFTLFNKAVLSPDGSTGIIGSRDNNGLLGADTIFYFRTSTAETLATATMGSEPGYTSLTPDGQYWVVLNQFSVSVISTQDFNVRREMQSALGEQLAAANLIFSTDSRYVFYSSSTADLVFQHDLWTTSIVAQIVLGDEPNNALDQTSTLAITPDGKIIAAVNFISNNIELLADAWVMDTAKFVSSVDNFTGLSLINLAPGSTTFRITALDNFGQLITGEGIANPLDWELPADTQISLSVAQLFGWDDSTERLGWITIRSERPEVAGYVSTGDTNLTRRDGVPLFRKPLFQWIVPEIVKREGASTELNIVNPYYNQTSYSTDQVLKDGTVQEVQNNNTAFPTNRHARTFSDTFVSPDDVTDGYLRMSAGQGLLFTEFFGGESALGALNGIDIEAYGGVTKIYSPQFAILPGFKSMLNVINGNEEDAEVTITLHQQDGTVIGAPYKRTLVKGEQIKDDLAEIFKDQPDVRDVTGWLEVESTHDRIMGTITFTNEEQTFLTSFELGAVAQPHLLFPMLAHDETYQTALALLNPNSEPAEVTVEIWGPGGTRDRSSSFVLPPNGSSSFYMDNPFPTLEPRLVGNLRVHSNRPIHGFALINDRNFTLMSAVPAIPLP